MQCGGTRIFGMPAWLAVSQPQGGGGLWDAGRGVSFPPSPGTPLESQLLPRAPESSPLPSAAPSLFPADVLLPSPEGDENRGRGAKRDFKQHLIKHRINFF